MNSATSQSALAEWRDHWPMTIAAMIAYSTIALQSYAFGPFVSSLEAEFGWTRAQAMTGVSVSMAVGVFINILSGMLADRFGSRRVGLTGLFVKTGSFALLATATGTMLNWSILWAVLAVGVVMIQASIWTKPIAANFDKSRGLAMAVVLSGTPITAMITPLLGTWLIGDYGWRVAFVGVAAAWLIVSFPIAWLFYREKPQSGAAVRRPAQLTGYTFAEGIRTRAFWCILISFATFSFYNIAIATNLVPLIAETGMSKTQAAGIAGLMGLVGIIARLSVGMLLDRMPGNIVGMVCQFLPLIGCAILLMDANSGWMLSLAVITFGIATGAEVDAALYLATRHMGLKAFAALFGAVITAGAMAASISPYVAGRLHDQSGNYDGLLWLIIVVMTIGAIAMGLSGKPQRDWGQT